jgi:hypothetical protein
MEHISMESIETHRKEVPIWKLCFVVSQGKKNTSKQIQEKMVWPIRQGIILVTQ